MKVIAALACRVQSKRLYAKPLQFLDIDRELTILEYQVAFLKQYRAIDQIVLAISEGEENIPFQRLAQKMGLSFIVGAQENVRGRLIKAAQSHCGDIIFRVTTECPFIEMGDLESTLEKHISYKAAITVTEQLPEGTYYELITLQDILRAQNEDEGRDRCEFCTLYMLEHPDQFLLQRLKPADIKMCRPDIRLTVDYPEDLIVVREVYKALKVEGQFIKVRDIIAYLDDNPSLKAVNGWIDSGTGRIWD